LLLDGCVLFLDFVLYVGKDNAVGRRKRQNHTQSKISEIYIRNLREKSKLKKTTEPHINPLFSLREYGREERTSQPLYTITLTY